MSDAISKTIPTLMSAGLALHNIKALKKKKRKVGDFVWMGVENIVGLSLIRETAGMTDW